MRSRIFILVVCCLIGAQFAYADNSVVPNLSWQPSKTAKSVRAEKNINAGDIKIPKAPKFVKINWAKELDLDEVQQQYWQEIQNDNNLKKQKIVDRIRDLHQELNDLEQDKQVQLRKILNEKQQIKMDKINNRTNRNSADKTAKTRPSRKKMRVYGTMKDVN